MIRDSAGNLYGTTDQGGTTYHGVVYELDAAGQETVLYNFTGAADGSYPNASVVRDFRRQPLRDYPRRWRHNEPGCGV